MKRLGKDKIIICHFVNHVTGKEDGVLKHIICQIKLLDSNRIKQIIVCQKNEYVEKILKELKVKYYMIKKLNKKFSIIILFQFMRIIFSENTDIINAHTMKTYVIAGLVNIFLRRKLIYSCHGSFIENDYNTKFEKIVYKILHSIICLCNDVRVLVPSKRNLDLLLNETKLFKDVKHFYNGYVELYEDNSNDKFITLELEKLKEKYFLVGYVGRLNREKNIRMTIKIFEQLKKKKQETFLLIFGSGEEEIKLKNYVLSNSIDNIKFYGYVKNASLYMKYFDVLLITSNREGIPFVVWEAMHNKIPVISTDAGGIKEIVQRENCGFIFNRNDINEAVEKICLLMNDKILQEKTGTNGYKAVLEKYNERNFKILFESYYNDLMNEKRN